MCVCLVFLFTILDSVFFTLTLLNLYNNYLKKIIPQTATRQNGCYELKQKQKIKWSNTVSKQEMKWFFSLHFGPSFFFVCIIIVMRMISFV